MTKERQRAMADFHRCRTDCTLEHPAVGVAGDLRQREYRRLQQRIDIDDDKIRGETVHDLAGDQESLACVVGGLGRSLVAAKRQIGNRPCRPMREQRFGLGRRIDDVNVAAQSLNGCRGREKIRPKAIEIRAVTTREDDRLRRLPRCQGDRRRRRCDYRMRRVDGESLLEAAIPELERERIFREQILSGGADTGCLTKLVVGGVRVVPFCRQQANP